MSFIDALRGILKPRVIVELSGGHMVIKERDRNSRMQVEISGMPESSIALQVNRFGHLPCICEGPALRKCDYILISEESGDISIVFVELKKTWTLSCGPREQLRRSLPFLKYLCSACEVDCNDDFRKSITSINYHLIAERNAERLGKQRVRVDPRRKTYEESYKDITVNSSFGSRVSHTTLVGV